MAQGRKQYNEKPYKVLAEPYDPAAQPVQVGVCVCTANAMQWTDGRPHVHAETRMIEPVAGDWIVEDLWTHGYQVLPDAEFQARFGGGNLADVTPGAEA